MIVYAQGDITKFDVDAIVNASNGFGYMGGKRCVKELHRGVAESIQFASQGAVERLARAKCKAHSFFGYSPGTVFVTDAPNLGCRKIIHAVTMRTPGSKAKIKKIMELIPKIVAVAEDLNMKSIAIPLLGCGTGGLDRKTVQNLLAHNLISDKVTFYIVTSL